MGGSMASTSSGSGSSFEGRKAGTVESDGGWALSWCKEAWWGERIAVSAGSSGIIRVSSASPSSSREVDS
jgi:nucleoporin SEH1